MDHKITVTKKNKKNYWIIALLILVIIGVAIFVSTLDSSQQQQISMLNSLIQANQTSVTQVEEGPMKVVIENIIGTVRSNQSVDLKWETTGTVETVNVNVGDTVYQGDVLAELDPLTLSIDVQNAQVDLDNAKDDLEKLENNSEAISSALAALTSAQQTLQDAQKSYDSLDPSRVSSDAMQLAYEAYLSADNDYQSAIAKFEEVRDEPIDASTRIKRLGDVGGYRSVRDNALAEYRRYLGETDEMERQVREAALGLADATFEENQYLYNKSSLGPTEAQINAAQAKIDAALEKMNNAKLIAPFSGQVTQIETKEKDVISANDTSMTETAIRIEDQSTFYIDTTVNELNVNLIKEGQEASIVFTGISDKTYHGTVTTIADTDSTANRSVSFGVVIKIDDADELVKSGMSADISMTIADMSDILYAPQSSFDLKNGEPYVNLKKVDGTFEWIPVEVGIISGTKVQILSDNLKAGDEIEADVNVESETDTGMMGFGGMMGGGDFGGGGGGGGPQ